MKKLIIIFGLIWLMIPFLSHAQNTTGTSVQVTETNGLPIAGATISINNTRRVVIADAQGKINFQRAETGLITVSATGFKSRTISFDTIPSVIVLEEDVARLDEVVVTGLSTTVKRRNLANAVTTISSKELSGTAAAQ